MVNFSNFRLFIYLFFWGGGGFVVVMCDLVHNLEAIFHPP